MVQSSYSASWWVETKVWKVARTFIKPRLANRAIHEPRTTSHARVPPSGYVMSSGSGSGSGSGGAGAVAGGGVRGGSGDVPGSFSIVAAFSALDPSTTWPRNIVSATRGTRTMIGELEARPGQSAVAGSCACAVLAPPFSAISSRKEVWRRKYLGTEDFVPGGE